MIQYFNLLLILVLIIIAVLILLDLKRKRTVMEMFTVSQIMRDLEIK